MLVSIRASTVVLTLLAVTVAVTACKPKAVKGTLAYTKSCTADTQCLSGHCLEASPGQSFCSQTCADDAGCTAADTLYCCESLTDKAYCVRASNGTCRAPSLGDGCAGPGDPFCARGGMSCQFLGGSNACTLSCLSDNDCAQATRLMTCQSSVCTPIDASMLPRLTSNCAGDRDCPAGQLCQVDLDNPLDPQALVTVCSGTPMYGPQKAGSVCTADKTQCDRYFCLGGYCPATCINDSYCAPGFSCAPLKIGIRSDQPSLFSVVGMCEKTKGSTVPCDQQTNDTCISPPCAPGTCPAGESCQYHTRFDGGQATVCLTKPSLTQTTPPVSSTLSRLDQSCSTFMAAASDPTGTPQWSLVGGKVVLCESDVCLNAGYCSTPCLADVDCPADGTTTLQCIYAPFQPHCDRTPTTGAADGVACTQGTDCKGGNCVGGFCVTPCRADGNCAAGSACAGDPRLIDVFGTGNLADAVIDTPGYCQATPGFDATAAACPATACAAAGTVCRAITAADGGLRGVCATPVAAGKALGATCSAHTDCAAGYCLTTSGSQNGTCSQLCVDDADCGTLRCIPISNTGTRVDRVCGKSPGSVADGVACAQHSDCASALCVEGKCEPVCPRGVAAGGACTSAASTCLPVAYSVDARFTAKTQYDDRFDVLAGCGEIPLLAFNANPTACATPRQFVFRNVLGALQGYCMSPIADALDQGKTCRTATECKSGLCVDNSCTVPCVAAPDSCGNGGQHCDATAPAILGEVAAVTGPAPGCRQPCSQDSDCAAGKKCEPDMGVPRFCR